MDGIRVTGDFLSEQGPGASTDCTAPVRQGTKGSSEQQDSRRHCWDRGTEPLKHLKPTP